MEPMSLGSPNNSGPSSPATTPSGSPYLPAFLLGEPTSPLPGSTSPKMKRVSFSDSPTVNKEYYRQDVRSPSYLLNQSYRASTAPSENAAPEKGSGPPIRGLFDTVTPQPAVETYSSDINAYLLNASKQYSEQRVSPPHHVESTESTWVTVFGYPGSAASFILAQLSHCGNIVATRAPVKGNWVHLQFNTKLEARRALLNNGKVFAGTVMIGVVPCKDQGIISQAAVDKENRNTSEVLSPIASASRSNLYPDLSRTLNGTHPMNTLTEASVYESPLMSPKFMSARNLQCRTGEAEVFAAGGTPQKNTGIVAKAMEYVFGW